MNLIKKIRYKKILEIQEKDSELASVVLYFLQCGDRKQRKFVERTLDKYTYILNPPFNLPKSISLYNIPDEIVSKLRSSYGEKMAKALLNKNQAMIEEMNEIF